MLVNFKGTVLTRGATMKKSSTDSFRGSCKRWNGTDETTLKAKQEKKGEETRRDCEWCLCSVILLKDI